MPKAEPTPRVQVSQRVEVRLSREEIEHALRCWISQGGASLQCPQPKVFSEVFVDLGDCYGATLVYEAAPPQAEAAGAAEGE